MSQGPGNNRWWKTINKLQCSRSPHFIKNARFVTNELKKPVNSDITVFLKILHHLSPIYLLQCYFCWHNSQLVSKVFPVLNNNFTNVSCYFSTPPLFLNFKSYRPRSSISLSVFLQDFPSSFPPLNSFPHFAGNSLQVPLFFLSSPPLSSLLISLSPPLLSLSLPSVLHSHSCFCSFYLYNKNINNKR